MLACALTLAALAASADTALPRVVTTGQPVALTAVHRGTPEKLYYLFDPGDGRLIPTARGRAGFTVTQPVTWSRPGTYTTRWQAVTLSGLTSGWHEGFTCEVTGPAIPSAPLPVSAVTAPAGDLSPATVHDWSSGPADRYDPLWVAILFPGICALETVNLTRAPDAPFPEQYAIEYTTDGGATWLEVPSAIYQCFPDPGTATVSIPLRGLAANGLRLISRCHDPAGIHLGSMTAAGSPELLVDSTAPRTWMADLNDFWLAFGSAANEVHDLFNPWWVTERPLSGGMLGMNDASIWSHWHALKISWLDQHDQPGPTHAAELWDKLRTVMVADDGCLGVTSNSMEHLGRNRHYVANAIYPAAVAHHYLFTRDEARLRAPDDRYHLSALDKARHAMRYMLEQMDGASGLITVRDPACDGTADSNCDNYWDAWPFGYLSAYENIAFYRAITGMAELEAALGDADASRRYHDLAALTRERYNQVFWDQESGRFIGCIDRLGQRHDFGFTFVNLEALAAGLATPEHADAVLSWLDGSRIIPGDTSTGADIYRWRIAPRSNTLAAEALPFWYLRDYRTPPDNFVRIGQSYGENLQNGGAILYTSYYDLHARLRYRGPDDAARRLDAILAEFHRDGLRRVVTNSVGHSHVLGILREFPESGLVPCFFVDGILGLRPCAAGLQITPRLPSDWDRAALSRFSFAGCPYAVTARRDCDHPATTERDGRRCITLPASGAFLIRPDGSVTALPPGETLP